MPKSKTGPLSKHLIPTSHIVRDFYLIYYFGEKCVQEGADTLIVINKNAAHVISRMVIIPGRLGCLLCSSRLMPSVCWNGYHGNFK